MNDQVLVRVLNGRTNGEEQTEALRDPKPAAVAILVKRPAPDVLHDEVGKTIFSAGAIEQASDVGMLEPGQDLTLVAEAVQNEFGIQAPIHQLHRDLLLEVVHPHGAIHGPHPAAPDLLPELVMT